MSNFDPFQLYSHKQRASHKGQIIQKRPVNANYAASADELKRAILVVKTYGYSISKTIHFTDFSMYGGTVSFTNEKRYVALSDIFNQTMGNNLKKYNPDIFNNTPSNILMIVNISEIYIASYGNNTVNLIDGTTFVLSSYGYRLLPNDNNTLTLLKLSPYDRSFVNRGTPQQYNNGVIYDVSNSPSNYNALKYGTPLEGQDLRYIDVPTTVNVDGFVNFTLSIIVNS